MARKIFERYCVTLRFKDQEISPKAHHAHLFVKKNKTYFQIIDNDKGSRVDLYYSVKGSLGSFEDSFEIVESEVTLYFDKSRVYRLTSFENDGQNNYFTIYVSNICLIKPNIHKEFIDEGKAVLDKNGLDIVNLFYSFFTNLKNKNQFCISRMHGMSSFYEIGKITFRPELDFTNNEKRGSEKFTVKKIPVLAFRFEGLEYEEIKRNLQIVCDFISFCFGIRVSIKQLAFRTEENIFVYRNTEPDNRTYVSKFLTVFDFLEKNYNIQKILKTNWFNEFSSKRLKVRTAIDNYLHSREVKHSASFLLLFNIIEIFNVSNVPEKFQFKENKDESFKAAFEAMKNSLDEEEDENLFKDKWDGLINKISIKPLKSPLEQTLRENNITPESFGYSFNKLKKTRDKLTHGSTNSIKLEDLKSQIICLRKISICLILSNLGLKKDLKLPA